MGIGDNLKKLADEVKERAGGTIGDLKHKAGELADEHGDKVRGGIDKATDFVDEKLGGKAGDIADKVGDRAKDVVEKLEGESDSPIAESPPDGPPADPPANR